jgi:hypothetical protein
MNPEGVLRIQRQVGQPISPRHRCRIAVLEQLADGPVGLAHRIRGKGGKEGK